MGSGNEHVVGNNHAAAEYTIPNATNGLLVEVIAKAEITPTEMVRRMVPFLFYRRYVPSLLFACSGLFFPKNQRIAPISLLYEWSATTGSAAEHVAATVPITFVEPDGTEKAVDAIIGMHLLDVAHKNNIDLEGACGGELACSTCHLIFEKEVYDKLPAKLDDEDDMLDMALGLTAT
jgi:ferredoxin-2, mitochondrial